MPRAQIDIRLKTLKEEGHIELFELISEGQRNTYVWSKPLFMAEIGISREVGRLRKAACNLRNVDIQKALDWVQGVLKINFGGKSASCSPISLIG